MGLLAKRLITFKDVLAVYPDCLWERFLWGYSLQVERELAKQAGSPGPLIWDIRVKTSQSALSLLLVCFPAFYLPGLGNFIASPEVSEENGGQAAQISSYCFLM